VAVRRLLREVWFACHPDELDHHALCDGFTVLEAGD